MISLSIIQIQNHFPFIQAEKIVELIDAHKTEFQAILDGANIEWNGNNNVGRFTDNAKSLIDELTAMANGTYNEDDF